MTLVVTPGASDADSYASIAEADAYLALVGGAWTGTNADKEMALRRATAWIDATYEGRWGGWRKNGRDQALSWPRYGVYDAEGFVVAFDAIPAEIRNATCQAAARELAKPGALAPDVVSGTIARRKKVGPLEVEYAGSGGAYEMVPTLTVVDGILARLLTNATGGGSVDLLRV